MTKKMLIDAAHPEEVRVAVLDNGKVEDFDFESAARKPLRGNIYLARVTRVEPSLQAAFVEYGGNRHGFLAFSEIHPDYYQIPVADREALQAAEAEVVELAAELELAQRGDDEDDDFSENAELSEDDQTDENDSSDEEGITDIEADSAGDDAVSSAETEDASETDEQVEAASADDDNASAETEKPTDEEISDPVDEIEDIPTDEEEEEEDADDDAAEPSADKEDAPEKPVKRKRRTRKKTAKKKAAPAPEESAEIDASTDSEDQPAVEEPVAQTDEEATAESSAKSDIEEDTSKASDASVETDASSEESDTADLDNDAEDKDGDADQEDDTGDAPKSKSAAAKRQALFERYKEAKRKRSQLLRNYKIQEVIKRRQILLIQVVKEERGNKGAALTTYMSLAGRYCVLMPNTARGGGISRKIQHSTDRRRLRRVVDSLDVPQGMGLIIRTAGAKRTKTEIKRDYDYLLRLWENIRTLTLKSIAPCLIYEEASLIKRAIRDLYDKDISQVLVEGEIGYREAKDFMKMLMPSHAKHVQPYKEQSPIFLKHGVENQLDGMYQPSVRLKSGGYIVIHQTEALVAIDVNSGRATRERNIEQTALKTNIEAAYEAARQFRLRDLAGLIVLDFIDMEEPKNNRKVEKALKDAIKHDRARIQTGRISGFGLLEMSRQRRRSGIVDGTTQSCPTCTGAGVIRSPEMAAIRILRAIEGEAVTGKAGLLNVHASLDVAIYILNNNRDWLKRIEDEQGVTIQVTPDREKAGDDFTLEKSGVPRERKESTTVIQADQKDIIEIEDDAENDPDSDEQQSGERKKRRRRRRRKDAAREDRPDGEKTESADDESENSDASSDDSEEKRARDEEGGRKRRRRGRRGGRRNRRSRGDDAENTEDGTDDNAETRSSDGGEGQEAINDAASDVEAAPDAQPDAPETTTEGAEASDTTVTSGLTNGAAANGHAETALDDEKPTDSESLVVEPIEATKEPEPEPEAPPPSPSKPKRRGWWNRG